MRLYLTKVADIQETQLLQLQVNNQSDIIVATEATALISKYKTTTETKHHSVTNVYFSKSSAFKKKQLLF
jgi:hypothetical protein